MLSFITGSAHCPTSWAQQHWKAFERYCVTGHTGINASNVLLRPANKLHTLPDCSGDTPLLCCVLEYVCSGVQLWCRNNNDLCPSVKLLCSKSECVFDAL